jgi:hypothetical protein
VTTGPLGGQNPGTPEPMRREDINVPAFMRKKAD